MKIIDTKIEQVAFSRVIQGNTSEDLCTIPYEVHMIMSEGFHRDNFVSNEFVKDKLTSVVKVNDRYFAVSKSTSDMKKWWLSVTLPPGLDPRPSPKEWEVYENRGYLYDPRVSGNPEKRPTFKVREAKQEKKPKTK